MADFIVTSKDSRSNIYKIYLTHQVYKKNDVIFRAIAGNEFIEYVLYTFRNGNLSSKFQT